MPNRRAIEELADKTGAPFTWGSLVNVGGFSGIVVAARNEYVGIIIDDDELEVVRYYHPNDERIKYFRIIPLTRIKEWWVKHPNGDWEDIENLAIVCASTCMKARYKGWKLFNDSDSVSREDLLRMLARRKHTSDDRELWRNRYSNAPPPRKRLSKVRKDAGLRVVKPQP